MNNSPFNHVLDGVQYELFDNLSKQRLRESSLSSIGNSLRVPSSLPTNTNEAETTNAPTVAETTTAPLDRSSSSSDPPPPPPLTFHGVILRSELVTLLERQVWYAPEEDPSVQWTLDYAEMTARYPRYVGK